MRSILRAIAEALRSWFRSTRSGNDDDLSAQADDVAAAKEAQRKLGEDARRATEGEGRRDAAEETRRAADETQRQAEEARLREEEAARAAEAEQARRAEEEARAAAEREAQRQADEARLREEEAARAAAEAEQEARADAEQKAQHQAAEAQRRAEREAANGQADRQAEGARLREDEEEARPAADQNTQRKAEEERRRADGEARITARVDTSNGAGLCEDGVRGELDGEDASPGIDAHVQQQQQEMEAPRTETFEILLEPGDPVAGLGEPAVTLRGPRQFRSTPRAPAAARTVTPAPGEREARERAMPIEVRLVFEKAGFCRVTLLPRRAPGMPAELSVTGSGDPPELLALQDEWYQDVLVSEIGPLLLQGIEWAGMLPGGKIARLSLSGRELYVLTRHGELNGFVSTPRLVLGEEHVVLCVARRLQDVAAAITLTGSPDPTMLNSDTGIPAGWIGLRGVLPNRPVAPSPDGVILDALRPLAAVEIALSGGIRIGRQTWLNGFPPTIRLLGDTSSIDTVTIDGQVATPAADGGYAAPGWDSLGEHSVWCTSTSRTYAIRNGAEEWESWDAYAWSLGELSKDDSSTQSRPTICGVLVRAPKVARSDGRATVVNASNPVLLGARPGEIVFCKPRRDVRAGFCIGFPWFEPVWAVPADVLHCDKRTARVLLIGPPRPVEWKDQRRSRSGGHTRRTRVASAYPWRTAILDASRKGLKTEPALPEIAELWRSYKHHARSLRKGRR